MNEAHEKKVCKFSQEVRQMFLCRLENETFIIYQSFVLCIGKI